MQEPLKRGVGRPSRPDRKIRINFSFSPGIIRELEERIPEGERSAFIEKLLIEAFQREDEQMPKAS